MDWQQQKVGFFPAFFNIAETSRLVRIAERYRELGGHAIFFSHGGDYEVLAKEADFPIQSVEPIYTEDQIQDLMKYDHLKKLGDPFPDDWLIAHVLNEERAYTNHYNVVAVYTTILKDDELPSVRENILLEKFVPADLRDFSTPRDETGQRFP